MTKTPLLLALAAALASLAPSDTDACGYFSAPRVMLVTHHASRATARSEFVDRTFVVFPQTAPEDLAWRPLAVHSYDSTQIATNARTDKISLTLLGPSGTQKLSSSRHAFLKDSWDLEGTAGAIEVKGARTDAKFALAGPDFDVSWVPVVDAGTTEEVTGFGRASVQRIGDTRALLVSNETGPKTIVKRGDLDLGTFDGYAVGAMLWSGQRYLLVQHQGKVQPVRI